MPVRLVPLTIFKGFGRHRLKPILRWDINSLNLLTYNLFLNVFQLSLLIYDLLLTEVWKEEVFTEILDTDGFEPKTTFPLYMAVSQLEV